MEHNSF